MSRTRGFVAALAVCVLMVTGSAGCASSDAYGQSGNGQSSVPAGKLLDDTDQDGHRLREVDEKGAPRVAMEVQPDNDGSWDVRLTVTDFRFSPAGTAAEAVAGRGVVGLFVDGRPVATLRGPDHRLAAGYLPHGTHHVTVRLYADDDTAWAVDGEPVECTADITASAPEPTPTVSTEAASPRTGGRGSPDRGGEAS
ncbi:hypothetical protein [Streptomyces griseus]|uniref:hypothetical protein n=1 Tax=Streptomyces griseus TaxID=1911 RepID=UPI00055A6D10|nr:hypothetical protein [Streptomyces griseus]